MREITHCYELNGTEMQTPEQAHHYLKNQLGFPEHYGMNLDALADCLTDYQEETIFWIQNSEKIHFKILHVLEQISQRNPFLMIILE